VANLYGYAHGLVKIIDRDQVYAASGRMRRIEMSSPPTSPACSAAADLDYVEG